MPGESDFEDAILAVVESRLVGMHVVLPGRIEKYDRDTFKANVKPLLKKKYNDGTEQELPIIVNVPVVWPRTANFEMSAPMERGDGVLLIFCERSLDAWLSKGGIVAPSDGRKFDLSDAIAIPGLYSFKQRALDSGDDVSIRYKKSSIRIKKDGGIEMGGDTDTLRALIDERLVNLFNAHTHPVPALGTSGPPTTPLVAASTSTITTKAG